MAEQPGKAVVHLRRNKADRLVIDGTDFPFPLVPGSIAVHRDAGEAVIAVAIACSSVQVVSEPDVAEA